MPARKRKINYPVARTSTKQPPAPIEPTYTRQSVVAIDVNARSGRTDLAIGDKVRIIGTGLHSGEPATIERFAGSAIPTAVVRTDSGATRQVRTIDLEPIRPES